MARVSTSSCSQRQRPSLELMQCALVRFNVRRNCGNRGAEATTRDGESTSGSGGAVQGSFGLDVAPRPSEFAIGGCSNLYRAVGCHCTVLGYFSVTQGSLWRDAAACRSIAADW